MNNYTWFELERPHFSESGGLSLLVMDHAFECGVPNYSPFAKPHISIRMNVRRADRN
jgi:hypothetical protein